MSVRDPRIQRHIKATDYDDPATRGELQQDRGILDGLTFDQLRLRVAQQAGIASGLENDPEFGFKGISLQDRLASINEAQVADYMIASGATPEQFAQIFEPSSVLAMQQSGLLQQTTSRSM